MKEGTLIMGAVLTIAGCGGGGDIGTLLDTGTQAAESIELRDVMSLDWMSVEHGLISATDISHDLDTLEDLSVGIKFLSDSYKGWTLEYVRDHVEQDLPHCMYMSSDDDDDDDDDDERTWEISASGCNIGDNNSLLLSGSGTLEIDDEEVSLEFDLTTITGKAEVEWELSIEWDDITEPSEIPTTELSLSADYHGELSGRHFDVSEALAFTPNNQEDLPDYAIPNSSLSEVAAITYWDDREDTLQWGAVLDENGRLYSGGFIAEYTSGSGVVATISSGNIAETLTGLSINSSSTDTSEQSKFQLNHLSIDWNLETSTYNGEVSFSFEDDVMVFLPSWSANVKVEGFTTSPIQISGNADTLSVNGSIELSYSYTNNLLETVTSWVNTNTTSMTFAESTPLASSGSISAASVAGVDLEIFFQEDQSSYPWVLMMDTRTNWTCKNLETGEENTIDQEPSDHSAACPN